MTFIGLATGWLDVITFWLVQPLLILLLGIFLGKVLEQVISFIGAEVAPGNHGISLAAYLASWGAYIVAVCYALSAVRMLAIVLYVLGALIGLVVLVHVTLAAFDMMRNLLSAVAVRRRWKPGMSVQSRTLHGIIATIGPALTRVSTSNGDVLMIPNRTMKTMKPVKN